MELSSEMKQIIERSDTFFLSSFHPERGADISHRGGAPGFVSVDSNSILFFSDYPGNNMFNSFGNIHLNPEVSLLFIDFEKGQTLHLQGKMELEFSATEKASSISRVRFKCEACSLDPSGFPLQYELIQPS